MPDVAASRKRQIEFSGETIWWRGCLKCPRPGKFGAPRCGFGGPASFSELSRAGSSPTFFARGDAPDASGGSRREIARDSDYRRSRHKSDARHCRWLQSAEAQLPPKSMDFCDSMLRSRSPLGSADREQAMSLCDHDCVLFVQHLSRNRRSWAVQSGSFVAWYDCGPGGRRCRQLWAGNYPAAPDLPPRHFSKAS